MEYKIVLLKIYMFKNTRKALKNMQKICPSVALLFIIHDGTVSIMSLVDCVAKSRKQED